MKRQSLLACSIFALSLTAGAQALVQAQTVPAPAETPAAVAADPAALEVAEAIRDGFRHYLFDPALVPPRNTARDCDARGPGLQSGLRVNGEPFGRRA